LNIIFGEKIEKHTHAIPPLSQINFKTPPPPPPKKKKKKKSLLLQPIEKSRTNLNVAFKREELFYKFCKNTYKEGLLRSCTES